MEEAVKKTREACNARTAQIERTIKQKQMTLGHQWGMMNKKRGIFFNDVDVERSDFEFKILRRPTTADYDQYGQQIPKMLGTDDLEKTMGKFAARKINEKVAMKEADDIVW
jgi:hypothetical protein